MKDLKHHFAARRRMLRYLAWSGALGAGGLSMVLQAALAGGRQTGMRSIKGQVLVDGQPATLGQQIRLGQQVSTGPGGEAVFVIGENAFLQHENSRFETDSAAGVVVLRYLTGKILSVFGKGGKRLETPTATIGIRGTGCYIEAMPEQVYFCLCYGTADIEPLAMPGMRKTISTSHHEHPMTIDTETSHEVMKPASVINHTDSELIMLEELVGRVPPFYGMGYKPY
jgi:hypothetical protein